MAVARKKLDESNINIIVSNEDEFVFEKKLLIAVLERAIRDYLAASKSLHNSAKEWFNSRETDFVFGYLNISRVLGFNPIKLLSRLDVLRSVARKNKRSSREIYRILSDLDNLS